MSAGSRCPRSGALKASGPGSVAFGGVTAEETSATFSVAATYWWEVTGAQASISLEVTYLAPG